MYPFERFTERAKKALTLAQEEAESAGHSYIGTEHLLLGLLGAAERNPRGDFSPETVSDLGIDPARVRQEILDELRRLAP